jgi:hypothetical protein
VALDEIRTRLDEAVCLLAFDAAASVPPSSLHHWLERLTDFPIDPDNAALTKASRNKNWLMRLGAALHPKASDATLELLSADADTDVAAAARMKLSQRASSAT